MDEDIIRRNDSFDIGKPAPGAGGGGGGGPLLGDILSPSALMGMFNMTEDQAKNVQSLAVGAGTGFLFKQLTVYVGPIMAGAIAGLVSGYLAEKFIRPSK
ncbi:MAG: hypothetical protein PHU70_00545 [Dehalococcoidia bacterium]|nr:hypothetical protein [Dehalococcoidia bacterium]